jgi:hypothetical protein
LEDISLKAKPTLFKVDNTVHPPGKVKITEPSELEQVSTQILVDISQQLNSWRPSNEQQAQQQEQIRHNVMELIVNGHNYSAVNSCDPDNQNDNDLDMQY